MRKFIVTYHEDKCKGCELCRVVCPKKLLVTSEKSNNKGYFPVSISDNDACIGCISCALMCPEGAIEIFEKEAE